MTAQQPSALLVLNLLVPVKVSSLPAATLLQVGALPHLSSAAIQLRRLSVWARLWFKPHPEWSAVHVLLCLCPTM
jgi:hypothetical protein